MPTRVGPGRGREEAISDTTLNPAPKVAHMSSSDEPVPSQTGSNESPGQVLTEEEKVWDAGQPVG